jgi:predicted phage-related endonuclease
MNIINLAQNRLEWLGFRRNRLGASDFCQFIDRSIRHTDNTLVLMNKINQVAQDKTKTQRDNSFMQWGRWREPFIRDIINNDHSLTLGEDCQPLFVQSKVNLDIIASLDGFSSFFNIIFEIKTTSISCPIKYSKLIYKYLFQVIHQYYIVNSDNDAGLAYLVVENSTGEIQCFKITKKNTIFYLELDNEIKHCINLSHDDWLLLCNFFLSSINNKLDVSLLDNIAFILKNLAL